MGGVWNGEKTGAHEKNTVWSWNAFVLFRSDVIGVLQRYECIRVYK